MLIARKPKQIPERLCHYTSFEAMKSILANQDGKGICFWAFSNRYKNDEQEIRMGKYMLNRILNSDSFTTASLLHSFRGYDNSASVSFMEGEVNQHMLDVYGHVRLEFDLRGLGTGLLGGGLIECEYIPENELKEYADEYCYLICKTYNSIPSLQKKYGKVSTPPIEKLINFIMMENDIMTKVLGLKEMKWSEEKEWRKVIELKNGVEVLTHNGKPYTKYYLDKTFLTGVTLFCSNNNIDVARNEVNDITNYLSDKGYQVKVRLEVFK